MCSLILPGKATPETSPESVSLGAPRLHGSYYFSGQRCREAAACAASEAWLVGGGAGAEAEPHETRPLRAPPRPAVPSPPPPGPRPVPPTVPWPQSLRCGPMNGVAFCLVGIPPRPEPRPPQVRAQSQGRAGRDQGPRPGWGHCAHVGGHCGGELGVPLRSRRRNGCARPGRGGGPPRRVPDGPGVTRPGPHSRLAVPGPGRPGSGGGRPAPFVRDFQAGRPPPFPLPKFSFSVGEGPAQLEPQGVGEGSRGGTTSARPLRVGLRCKASELGTPSPAWPTPSARSGCGWVPERGARGITQRWAWVLSSASC